MELIVSLPGNELELALASEQGGADAVKVHMNATHRASGLCFGGFSQEAPRIREIMSKCKLKAGLMPGQASLPEPDELNSLLAEGLDFIDIYAHHLTADLLTLGKHCRLIPAIDHTYDVFNVSSLTRLTAQGKPVVSMLEASVVPPEAYGTRLTAKDLAHYASIVRASAVPVVVPTQKFILPGDVAALAEAGIKALMIGAIVTGPMPGGIERVTSEFRDAISRLRP